MKNNVKDNIKDTSILSHTCMGKFASKSKTGIDYWNECLELYRASKLVRTLRTKYTLLQLSQLTNYSKNYICGVQELRIRPKQDFINKLKQLERKETQ